jgi:hypothetical protein
MIPWLACLAVILCCVPMFAPGFTFYGNLHVDLAYPEGFNLHGRYPSIWRLRFNSLEMGEVGLHDVGIRSNPVFPPRPVKPVNAPPLDPNLPLNLTLNGTTYPVGQLTPAQVTAMGGQSHTRDDSLTFGSLPLHAGSRLYPAGTLLVIFLDDRPVSFSISVTHVTSDPLDLELSYRGGPPLRLPASEADIIRAFGTPSGREERLVLPDKHSQPLLTASNPGV